MPKVTSEMVVQHQPTVLDFEWQAVKEFWQFFAWPLVAIIIFNVLISLPEFYWKHIASKKDRREHEERLRIEKEEDERIEREEEEQEATEEVERIRKEMAVWNKLTEEEKRYLLYKNGQDMKKSIEEAKSSASTAATLAGLSIFF